MSSSLRLTSVGHELDLSPVCFGSLKNSIEMIGDAEVLHRQMAEDGYLFLPGYLVREEVRAARQVMAERLAAEGHLDPNRAVEECAARPGVDLAFRPDLARDNAPLFHLLYEGRMMQFFEGLLGGPVLHFDFTWIRAVAPGHGTNPHCDIVYMGRGTKNLYTAWTPLGDVPFNVGGLMILEHSHQHERLNRGYGRKDVDTFCVNRREDAPQGLGGGGTIRPGGALSLNPAKLRERLGGRWLSAEYRMGDLLVFGMFTVHASIDNQSDEIRLSSDTRYQLQSEPADERWMGENPIAHGPKAKKGMIC